jgi:hypothetical protein
MVDDDGGGGGVTRCGVTHGLEGQEGKEMSAAGPVQVGSPLDQWNGHRWRRNGKSY